MMIPRVVSLAVVGFAAGLLTPLAAAQPTTTPAGDSGLRRATVAAIAVGNAARGPRTFADSAAELLQHFVIAVRQRYLSSFRGQDQRQVTDRLNTRDPIVVRIVEPTYDASSARAFFRLQVEDNVGQTLVPPIDLEVKFERLPGGLRIAAILPNPTANLPPPNPTANRPAITPLVSRARGPSTFADSAAEVLQHFITAIRRRDISSIRGKLPPAFADQLERGVNSTQDPIVIHLIGLKFDQVTAKAFFRLRVEDSAELDLVPAVDLEVTFQRVPGGMRIATVDPRR